MVALASEGLWKILASRNKSGRYLAGSFQDSSLVFVVMSFKEDHKLCHSECRVCREGLLICHFCLDLDGPYAKL